MTLTFLGQEYEAIPAELAPVESTLTGKYRGIPVQFSSDRPLTPMHQVLTYRGIRYSR